MLDEIMHCLCMAQNSDRIRFDMDKLFHSQLLVNNDLTKLPNNVWSMDEARFFTYTDGAASEVILKDILRKTDDKSSKSLGLESAIYDWISSYHFSADRANIYRFLDLSNIRKGLELGCGCGAISRYLGEKGICLDAVEGNLNRAAITRQRCDVLNNINVIHANFNDLTFPPNAYDGVFLNGVVEYAEKFSVDINDGHKAVTRTIELGLSCLSEKGIVFIAIENQMGLKYWLGAPEDHYGKPYVGLYDYPRAKGIRTYSKTEWNDIIASLPEKVFHTFLYPFPDYKMAKVVLSEDYIRQNAWAYSHLYRIPSQANGNPISPHMHEFLMWEGLQKKGLLEDFSNSFFILLSRDKKSLQDTCPHDFQHFSGSGRKPQFRATTIKRRNSDYVEKQLVFAEVESGSELLHQDLKASQHVYGPLLVTDWLYALTDEDGSGIEKCFLEYFQYLQDYCQDSDRSRYAVDLLPFNIIVGTQGWHAIDTEWKMKHDLTPEFIYFRALFWFPPGNEKLLQKLAIKNNLLTRREFVQYGFRVAGLDLDQSLDTFIEQEESLQKEISHQIRLNPVKSALLLPIKIEESYGQAASFVAQLYWATAEENWAENKSLACSAKCGGSWQQIRFSIPSSAGEIEYLRFDPADRAGFFRLRNITITSLKDDLYKGYAWHLEGIENIAAAVTFENIQYCHNGLGEILVSTGEDPHLIIQIPQEIRHHFKDSGIAFEAELDWPKSTDYLIAMDGLGRVVVEQKEKLKRLEGIEEHSEKQAQRISNQAAQLREANDKVRAKEIYIENIEKEIEAMRQTKVWRVAELLRSKFYYRLLDIKVLLQKSRSTIRKEGLRQFFKKARRTLIQRRDVATLGLTRKDYDLWVEHHRLTEFDQTQIKETIDSLLLKPLISIVVPVYNVDRIWLEKTIDSVRKQLYQHWELCLCDDLSPSPHIKEVLSRYCEIDKRIKLKFKDKNEGIALTSNAALTMVTGEYVGLLDHDDELSIDALYENVKAINENPSVGLLYSDEDKLDMQGRRCDPFFKPDFSPELLHSQNYICHFTVIKKTILDEVGGFRQGYDGSQDHDLILRVSEKSQHIHHIPKILYHWRKIPGSTAAVYDSKSYAWEAGRKAVADSLARAGRNGEVTFAKYQGSYRVIHQITGNPLVSIIIPFKDKKELLQKCIESILAKSSYQHFEIIGISNNSVDPQTLKTMESLAVNDSRVSFVEYNVPFNFSDICNFGVTKARGEYIVLLNNDIEVISPQWIEALLNHAQIEGVGAVGGKLYYPDDRIQHAGIVIGMTGVAGHAHILFDKDDVGYYARAHVDHNVSALTGACMMVKKGLYVQVGGLDSQLFGVAYNDVDFCLKLIERGYRNVMTPYCEMYHYESQSRGYEDTPEKLARLNKESDAFRNKWQWYFKESDPYFSPHLSLEHTNFTIHI